MIYLLSLLSFVLSTLNASLIESDENFLTGNNFKAHCDHYVDLNEISLTPSEVGPAEIIFVSGPRLRLFFEEFHPKLPHPYILVSHDESVSAPCPFSSYLNDPKLIAWFGQNVQHAKHPKLHPIPLGLQNKRWWFKFGDLEVTKKKLSEPEQERTIELYMNFNVGTYKRERELVYNLFKNQDFCYISPAKGYDEYLDDLRISKFVLSPRGYALDCHRIWECLLMGAIPIVKTSDLDPLFEDLPILIINNWSQITPNYLKFKYEEMKNKNYKMEKAYIPYWIDQIRRVKADYLQRFN